MDYIRIRLQDRRGFALLVAVFFMLAFAVISYTVLQFIVNKSDINIQTLATSQAFYRALAAKNFALEYYGSWGNDFTNSTQFPGFSRDLGSGSFSVSYSNQSSTSCNMTFTGTARGVGPLSNMQRSFNQHFESYIPNYYNATYRSAFLSAATLAYNLFSPNVSTELAITGDVYLNYDTRLGWNTCFWGCLDPGICQQDTTCSQFICCNPGCTTYCSCFANNRFGPVITGNVFVKGKADVYKTTITGDITASKAIYTTFPGCLNTIGGSINSNNLSVYIPPKPAVNQAYYNNEINTALNNPNYTLPTMSTLDLGGRNRYRNGDLTISGTINGGPANIAATGMITVSNGATIGERISLIAGNIIIIGTSGSTIGTTLGGSWGGSSINGAGSLLYAKASSIYTTDQVGGIEVRNSNTRLKGRIIIPTTVVSGDASAFRSVIFDYHTKLWGIIHSKCINNWFSMNKVGEPVIGEVKGSIAIDGPIWSSGSTYGQGRFLLRSANITYDSAQIPLAIKGLYHYSPSQWQEPN